MLDEYVARWSGLYKETCEATHVRGEQSAEVLDLRMACLDERLASVRALADTLASADADVVDKAVGAAAALPCARPLQRRRRAARDRQAAGRSRRPAARSASCGSASPPSPHCPRPAAASRRPASAARCWRTAKQIGYLPLQAEASFALGQLFDGCLDTEEALADLEDAVMSAEASRYDEIAIEAAAMLASAYAERTHDVRAARPWLRLAEAILARFPGHPRLEARVTMSRASCCSARVGWRTRSAQASAALALQEVLSGPSSFEVGDPANNIAIVLHELGRDEEAEASIRRAREITRQTFGDDSGQSRSRPSTNPRS